MRTSSATSRFCFLLVSAVLLWRAETFAAEYYSFSPDYYLNGSADVLYAIDKTDANGTKSDVSSLAQKYTLGLNGPLIGPYIGLFALQSRFTMNDLSVNGQDADVKDYGVGGNAEVLPTSQYPFSLYFDINRATSDEFGLKANTDTNTYGFTVNPRFFRGTTLLTYDHNSVEGNVAERTSFSDTRDRGNLFYRDGWRFGKDTRLDYQYQLTVVKENQETRGVGRDSTEAENNILITYYTRFGEKTEWLNSFAGDSLLRRESGAISRSDTSGSARYESSLAYDYTRNIRGFLKLDHLTLKVSGDQPVSNTDAISVTGTYEQIPNPIPKLILNLQASGGWERGWEASRDGAGASLTLTSRWPVVRHFDILNDIGYSYTATSGGVQPTGAVSSFGQGFGNESVDALAYRFGLQGRATTFLTWYADYLFQRIGLFTDPASAGTQHTVALGEQIAGRNFTNQSFYTLTKSDTVADESHSLTHLLWSLNTYQFSPTLSAQVQAYLQDTTVSLKGVETTSTTGNVATNVNWNPFLRILVNAGGEVGYTKSTGGNSLSYRLQSALNWLLPFINLRLLYRYEQQDQSTSSGDFKSSEHRVEVQATTSFSMRLGSFAPGRGSR